MPVDAAPDEASPPEERLEWATDGLRIRSPDLSAYRTTTGPQKVVGAVLGGVLLVIALLDVIWAGVALVGALLLVYMATIIQRLLLLVTSLKVGGRLVVSDAEAEAFPDAELPMYSILVPAFHEPAVMPQLVECLQSLDYPSDRLEILLVLEADDLETLQVARTACAGTRVSIIEVPASEPRTKPKALNYALLSAAGEIVAVYDAEDRPERLQLKRAAIALRHADERMVCVQGQLNYFNPDQNTITRWFTLEYTTWFTQLLPGLVNGNVPVPLGGTSNHFRRGTLIEVGGWDPYNVTEDADLGIRLHRLGYRVGVLESVTLEEANSDFINWVKQRSRWYKGYLQTWLLNMRHPVQLYRELGLRGFLAVNLFVGGTPLLAVVNPVFWLLTAMWFVVHPHFIQSLLPTPLFFAGLTCWIIGNFLMLYAFVLTAFKEERVSLLKAALLMPLYYVMMSLAAYKALIQLVLKPSYWEKTTHGLDRAEGTTDVAVST
jgi:cellulose synthase/poly-beta-1,6-N-acetylglucosamine synthase-like glycosyltransferase